MLDIRTWTDNFVIQLQKQFGGGIVFAGIQGSRARGEATETSDIDVVVIFDRLTSPVLAEYGAFLDTLPHRKLICGFVSGKEELENWEPSDLFQFCHDTKPLTGSLDFLFSRLDRDAVARAVKTGACNLYHSCVHNMLHEKSETLLKSLYKSSVFTVQAIYYLETGAYISSAAALAPLVSEPHRQIVEKAAALKSGEPLDFIQDSNALFQWAGNVIKLNGKKLQGEALC